MARMEWNSSFSVGVKEMDDQHVQLVELVNKLDEAMSEGKSGDVLGRLFDGLVTYAANHFKAEEKLMSSHDFPDYEGHREKHLAMTEQVLKLQSEFRRSQLGLGIKTMNFLTDWLTKHIMGTDKKYGIYLNSIGIS